MLPLATAASCAARELGIAANISPGKRSPASTATQPSTANIHIRPCLISASTIQSTVLIGTDVPGSIHLSGTICSLQSLCIIQRKGTIQQARK